MTCPRCSDTGMAYEGNGHRMSGYPYAEKYTAVSCSCDLGKALDAGERIPMPPVREMSDTAKAKADARKAKFTRRLEAFGNRIASEVRAGAATEPQWVKDRRKENAEYNA